MCPFGAKPRNKFDHNHSAKIRHAMSVGKAALCIDRCKYLGAICNDKRASVVDKANVTVHNFMNL